MNHLIQLRPQRFLSLLFASHSLQWPARVFSANKSFSGLTPPTNRLRKSHPCCRAELSKRSSRKIQFAAVKSFTADRFQFKMVKLSTGQSFVGGLLMDRSFGVRSFVARSFNRALSSRLHPPSAMLRTSSKTKKLNV